MTTQLQYGLEGDRPYGLYYQHSGRTPIPSLILAGLLVTTAGIALGFLSNILRYYLDDIRIALGVPILLGMALGFITARICRAVKVRSLAVSLALVAIAALAAYYSAWVSWIKFNFDDAFIKQPNYNLTYGDLILSPNYLFACITYVYNNGIWSIFGGDKISGIELLLFWLAEAATIFGSSLGWAYHFLRQEMYCESCKRWCGGGMALGRIAKGDKARLRETLEAHDFSYLEELKSNAGIDYWQVFHEYCPGCNRQNAISIRFITSKDKPKTIIHRLLLEPDEINALKDQWKIAGSIPLGGTVNKKPTAPDAGV